MANKFFFTVNLLIRSDTNIKNAISSVIGDEKFFRQNVQLILIDTIGTVLSTEICAKYSALHPDNIFFVDAVGENVADGYNYAAALSAGRYISYIDNYGSYSKGALNTIFNLLHSGRVPIFCIRPMLSSFSRDQDPDRSRPGGFPPLYGLSSNNQSEGKPYIDGMVSGTVHLRDTPDKFILFPGAYFFNRKIVSKLKFDSSMRFHYDVKFLIDALKKTYNYVYSEKCSYISSAPCEYDIKRYEPQYSNAFYTKAVNEFIIPMLKNRGDADFIMYMMMYLIEIKFALNADDDYKKVLIGSHVKEFFDSCSLALSYIDDTVILNRRLCSLSGIDEEMPFRLIRMKRKNENLCPDVDIVPPNETVVNKYRVSENRIVALPLTGEFVSHINGVLLSRSKNLTADIKILNYDKEAMYFDAVLSGCSYMDEDEFGIYLSYNGEKKPVIKSQVYTLKKYFGQAFLKRYSFRFFIPFNRENRIDVATLSFKYKKLSFRMNLSFNTIHSKLNNDMKGSYVLMNDKVVTYDKKSKSIVIKTATDSLLAISETRLLNEITKRSGLRERFFYRKIRNSAKAMIKANKDKKIILFYEDHGINYNGSLLFRYFFRHPVDNFIPYICVRKDSPEYNFLVDTNYDNILEIGSVKAKITALAADILFAEDCDPYDAIGFDKNDRIYLRDMIKAGTFSVKNYFITYETAQYNNRLRDNTQMVFCASPKEKENLLLPVYDYNEDLIKVTGNALLDAASDKREKIILIAPGKRKLFRIYENSGYYRFTESSFFKAYNGVLSDKELIAKCKESGWKIAVLMPESVEKYAALFPDDPNIKVYPYNEQTESALLSRASVLITDYSDLQYRFAYLGKTVLYFFPQGLPINSEHKGEGITRNGFGEVLFEKEELCRKLMEGIDRNFENTDKYRKRRTEFFGEIDKGNCRRIYEQTLRIIKRM